MKNIKALTLAFLLSVFGSSYALAEYGVTVGVTGSMAMIDASGTEIEGNAKERSDADASNNAGVASIFVEYNDVGGTGINLGIDLIPGAADVSSSVSSRSDSNSEGDSATNKAQAELENHMTFYATYGADNGVYVKLGYVQVDLNTLEVLGTGSKYGNETLTGISYGAGVEFDVYDNTVGRFEINRIEYEDISLRSSVARTGVTNNNLIEADLDVTTLSASLGYKF